MTASTREPTHEPSLRVVVTGRTVPAMTPMTNPVRNYDWGSATALAELQGREPDGRPEAELWMGAHPSAPSSLPLGAADGDGVTALVPLPDVIGADPEEVLGAAVLDRFGARLPFMLKLLAVARPLSLQVHPDAERALAVHGRPGSPYGDPFHKPELIVAIHQMEAIFGFRPADEAAALLRRLGGPRAASLADGLPAGADGPEQLHATLARLLGWPADDRAALVDGAVRASLADPSDRAGHWLRVLAGQHPGDPMALAPLLLDVIRLAPGDALFVPAGVPHAYLTGCGVEVLAASDNVVRAGLTSKPVATGELLEIVDCRRQEGARTAPEVLGEHEVAWRPAVPDFQLTRVHVPAGGAVACADLTGPQILLCTRGSVTVVCAGTELTLTPGTSAFLTAAAGPLAVTGDGDLYRAAPAL